MAYCKQCKKPMYINNDYCTRCYHSMLATKKYTERYSHQIHASHASKRYRFRKPKKPLSLIILVLCLMTIILISILSFYRLENALDKKVQLFSDAIDHKNTDQLIELVISNNQQLTNEEAKAYVSLINSFGGNKKFLHQLTSAAYHLKQNKGKTQDVELEGVTILTIHQQIHLFGLFKNFQFEIPRFNFTLDAKDNGNLTYRLNNKKYDVRLVKGHIVSLNAVPLGEYKLDATKKIGNRTYDGNIIFSLKKYGTLAKEDFSEKRFKVTTKNSYMFNKMDLVINDKNVGRLKDYITYGPFSGEDDLLVYGVGYVGNQAFKSNEVNVPSINSDESPVNVVLTFNEAEVFSQSDHQLNKKIHKNK